MLAQERRQHAMLLQCVNLVDTPGTNDILECNQRLTEELVPRADLLLFVMTTDHSPSRSEVDLLKCIR